MEFFSAIPNRLPVNSFSRSSVLGISVGSHYTSVSSFFNCPEKFVKLQNKFVFFETDLSQDKNPFERKRHPLPLKFSYERPTLRRLRPATLLKKRL